MNSTILSQQTLITLKRHALIVLFICYIPHIATQPVWLFILFSAAIGYRLIADYFSSPRLSWWIITAIVAIFLFVLSRNFYSSGFYVQFLLCFIVLKSLELNTVRDLKVVILCNFFLIFSALIVTQDLWVVVYLFTAILANLSIMVKLSAPQVSLRQIGGKGVLQLLIVIPLSILLFYVFPRINPLWKIPSITNVSSSLEEKMTPGSIAVLFNDESTAMRITFTKNPIFRGYWRGIILSFYNGQTWYPPRFSYSNFSSLHGFKSNEVADYDILLEPTQKKWLFYAGYPVAGESGLAFSPSHGMIQENKQTIIKRFSYSLKVRQEPATVLSSSDYAEATQLPANINPQLRAWAKEKFSENHNDSTKFIVFLSRYIHDQLFWYTLTPPSLSANKNQMDKFWFDTQRGFCEHYASAVTFILRAAGIPARVLIGYYGGRWNPITNTITLQQNTAHAWLEYWTEGVGWRQLDPTTFISSARVDQTIQGRHYYLMSQAGYLSIGDAPWREKINLLLDSVRYYSERWVVSYNQKTQQNLLEKLGLGVWSSDELLQVFVISIPVFFILIALYYLWQEKRAVDPLLFEYHLLQIEFRKFNIPTYPPATLKLQCHALMDKVPALSAKLILFVDGYERLRLMQSGNDSRENKKQTIALFKQLRYTLRKRKLSTLSPAKECNHQE